MIKTQRNPECVSFWLFTGMHWKKRILTSWLISWIKKVDMSKCHSKSPTQIFPIKLKYAQPKPDRSGWGPWASRKFRITTSSEVRFTWNLKSIQPVLMSTWTWFSNVALTGIYLKPENHKRFRLIRSRFKHIWQNCLKPELMWLTCLRFSGEFRSSQFMFGQI